ncbi:MAG: efflux RND transporter periplasmic adaptor subunit [Pirellulales bacterium]|nr:efflux RND transporter periplasmic adaptor subunit [Pirellulales bacterium]
MASTSTRPELSALRIDRSRKSSSRGTWLAFVLVVLALAAAGGGVAWWMLGDSFERRIVVKTDTVRVMTLGQASRVLTATGYLESRKQAAVGAKAPGRIAKMLVEEGDTVEAGDLLAELEHSDLDATLASRKVEVTQREAELNEAHNMLVLADRNFAREKQNFTRKAGTQAALDNAEAEFNTATARVAAMAAALESAKARVREAEESIQNMRVYAPFAGTIISKEAELGETIMPGGMGLASGRGSVATLADLSHLEVDTDVKEDYLGSLRRGQPAEIAVDAVPDRRYRGRLREIIPMGDRTRGIVKVKVEVIDPNDRLFPELSATVHFLPFEDRAAAGEPARAPFVPENAIVQDTGKSYVWRVIDGRAKRVAVEVEGPARDGLLMVLSGLRGGETVIANPPPELAENVRVESPR